MAETGTMTAVDGGEAIDRMYAALAKGDVAEAMACFTPDARVWHSFDRVEADSAEMKAQWDALVANFTERYVVDVVRQPTPTGFVQQHVMIMRTASGDAKAWALCIVVRMEGGLIARLDEYIDRAGFFVP